MENHSFTDNSPIASSHLSHSLHVWIHFLENILKYKQQKHKKIIICPVPAVLSWFGTHWHPCVLLIERTRESTRACCSPVAMTALLLISMISLGSPLEMAQQNTLLCDNQLACLDFYYHLIMTEQQGSGPPRLYVLVQC